MSFEVVEVQYPSPIASVEVSSAQFGISKNSVLNIPDNLPTDGVTDCAPFIQAKHDQLLASGGGTVYIPAGKYAVSTVLWHPSVSLEGAGRTQTVFVATANVPLLNIARRTETSDNVFQYSASAPADQRAFIYILARAPFDDPDLGRQPTKTLATDAWMPKFSNFAYNGKKANQNGNLVSAVYCERGANDPNYLKVTGDYPTIQTGMNEAGVDAKAYSACKLDNVEFYSCSGSGIYVGPDRQRFACYHTRSLNHGVTSGSDIVTVAHGWVFAGNDCLIGPECRGGGHTGQNVYYNNPSGANISQLNSWNGTTKNTSGAANSILLKNVNGGVVSASVLNGSVVARASTPSDTNTKRPIVFNALDFRPADELFSGNRLHGNPLGVPSVDYNANIVLKHYRTGIVSGCSFGTDAQSRGFEYLMSATDSGALRADFIATTEPGYKAFNNASPFYVASGASIGYSWFDPYVKTLKLGVATDGTTQGSIEFNSAVSFKRGSSGAFFAGTWAEVVSFSSPFEGMLAYATDLGPAGCQFVWKSGRWVPLGPQTIYQAFDVFGVASASEQLMAAVPVPAGLLVGQQFEVTFGTRNSDTVDAESVVAVRVNTTATVGTAGTAEIISTGGMTAANNSIGRSPMRYLSLSATSVRKLGTAGVGTGSFVGTASGTNVTNVSVPSLASQTYLCFVVQMAGATTVPILSYLKVDLLPS